MSIMTSLIVKPIRRIVRSIRRFLPAKRERIVNPPELVTDREVFSVLSAQCEKIIDTRKRLPDFVFRRSFANYVPIDYEYIYTREFAAFLLKLADTFQDESVNYMTLAPPAVDYYERYNCSFFGLASFKPSSLLERYGPAIIGDRNWSELRAGVHIGVFWGSSLDWAISWDRISWELAVIAVPQEVNVRAMTNFKCMDAAAVSSYMTNLYRRKLPAALDFNQRFLANYHLL
jgi:hypothetical protein